MMSQSESAAGDPFDELIALIDATSSKHITRNQRVKRVQNLIDEHPALLQRDGGADGLWPLQHAVENDAPLDIIKVLAEAHPKSIVMSYMGESNILRDSVGGARNEETIQYLVDQAIRYLRSTMSVDWKPIHAFDRNPIHAFFVNHCRIDGVVERVLEDFPEMSEDLLLLRNAVVYELPLEVLQRLKTFCYERAFAKRKDGEEATPLHVSCYEGNEDIIKLLLSPEAARAHDHAGSLPLHAYCDQKELDLDLVQALVAAYPGSIQEEDHDGMTPLHLVCGSDHDNLVVIRFLIEAYPESVHKRDSHGHTPFLLACRAFTMAGSLNSLTIQYFCEEYPRTVTEVDSEGSTPLHIVCVSAIMSELPTIQLILDTQPKNALVLDNNGDTPLHLLMYDHDDDQLPIIRLLVERCPQSARMLNLEHNTPLHVACSRAAEDNLMLIQFLTQTYPEALKTKSKLSGDVRLPTATGDTPLHIICRGFSYDMLDTFHYLVEACPDVMEPEDGSRGDTPLHTLCTHYRENRPPLECFQALAVSENAVKAKDHNGQTPLHILCECGVPSDIVQVLLDKCSSLASVQDDRGRIPLHMAMEGYNAYDSAMRVFHEDDLERLLEAFPNGIFVKDHDGKTPFSLACERNVGLGMIYQLIRVNPLPMLGLERGSAPQNRKRQRDS